MAKKYRLLGFSSPTDSNPSFSIPIFERDTFYYVQVINEDESIADFEKVENIAVHCYQGSAHQMYQKGDEAVYGVRDKFNELTLKSRSDLEYYLKEKIMHYIEAPFFYKSVSEFCRYSLPEFAGCDSGRDYLLRQVISNAAHKLHSVKYLQLGAADNVRPKKNASLQWRSSDRAYASASIKFKSRSSSARDLYVSFIDYVSAMNNKIAKEPVVMESLEISKYALPDKVGYEGLDLSAVREYLVGILNETIASEDGKVSSRRLNETGSPRDLAVSKSNAVFLLSMNDEGYKVTSGGLSLIIYVTSLLSQLSDGASSEGESKSKNKHAKI